MVELGADSLSVLFSEGDGCGNWDGPELSE